MLSSSSRAPARSIVVRTVVVCRANASWVEYISLLLFESTIYLQTYPVDDDQAQQRELQQLGSLGHTSLHPAICDVASNIRRVFQSPYIPLSVLHTRRSPFPLTVYHAKTQLSLGNWQCRR